MAAGNPSVTGGTITQRLAEPASACPARRCFDTSAATGIGGVTLPEGRRQRHPRHRGRLAGGRRPVGGRRRASHRLGQLGGRGRCRRRRSSRASQTGTANPAHCRQRAMPQSVVGKRHHGRRRGHELRPVAQYSWHRQAPAIGQPHRIVAHATTPSRYDLRHRPWRQCQQPGGAVHLEDAQPWPLAGGTVDYDSRMQAGSSASAGAASPSMARATRQRHATRQGANSNPGGVASATRGTNAWLTPSDGTTSMVRPLPAT